MKKGPAVYTGPMSIKNLIRNRNPLTSLLLDELCNRIIHPIGGPDQVYAIFQA